MTVVVGLIVTVLLAQGAIWYKLGRVEGKLENHLGSIRQKE